MIIIRGVLFYGMRPLHLTQLRLFAFGFLFSIILSGQATFEAPTISRDYSTPLLSQLADYELVRLSPEGLYPWFNEQETAFSASLWLGGTEVNPQLLRWELRSPNYQRSDQVFRTARVKSKSTQYRGQLPGEKTGSAIFTVSPDFVLGSWETNGERYTLEPLWLNTPEAPKDLYVWYRDQDLKSPTAECSVGGKESLTESVLPAAKNSPGGQLVELAVAMDNELYRIFGDERTAESWVLGLLALVQRDYDLGFDDRVQFSLSNLFLSTGDGVPEPWSNERDAQSLLSEFRAWGENQSVFTEPYDVAAFWTDRDFNGNTIGYAYIDAMCRDRRYHVVQRWRTGFSDLRAIWSHELGHNFSARHINGQRFIMNPTLSSINDRWASQSQTTIRSNLPDYECLRPFGWQYFRTAAGRDNAALFWGYGADATSTLFSIQRAESENGPWQEVFTRPAMVEGEIIFEYQDADPTVTPGRVYFYRIEHQNANGDTCFSETRRVLINYIDGGRLSPNPTNGEIRVLQPIEAEAEYLLFNVAGQLIQRGQIRSGSNVIDLNHLPTGVYYYHQFGRNQDTVNEKVVKF